MLTHCVLNTPLLLLLFVIHLLLVSPSLSIAVDVDASGLLRGLARPCLGFQFSSAYDRDGNYYEYFGRTYEDWGNRWWYWANRFNKSVSPVYDRTGRYGKLLQPNNVLFLAMNYEGAKLPVKRRLKVHAKQFLFFPVNSIFFTINPPSTKTKQFLSLIDLALNNFGYNASALTQAEKNSIVARLAFDERLVSTQMSLQIESCQLNPLKNGLVYTSPSKVFSVSANKDNGWKEGNHDGVQSGYWIMLRISTPGNYILRFTSSTTRVLVNTRPFNNFYVDVTYNLTVVV